MSVFSFEEEILTSQMVNDVNGSNSSGTKVIIGSGTFNQVQAQLNSRPSPTPEAAAVTTASQKPDSLPAKPKLTFSGRHVKIVYF